MSDWLLLSSEFTEPRPESFAVKSVSDVETGLKLVASHLRTASRRAHKSRCDLDALSALSGQQYSQVETVPDELFAQFRDRHDIEIMELLPMRAGHDTSVGTDAVLLLHDRHAAVKGLPPNELASRLLAACGLRTQCGALVRLRGDAFLIRLREENGELSLGGGASADMMGTSDWLEKAQRCASHTGTPGERSWLLTALEPRVAAAAAVAAACAPVSRAGDAASAVATDGAAEGTAQLGMLTWEESAFGDNGIGAEVVARVAVPATTKAKHVRCEIKAEWLRLEVATLPPAAPALVLDAKPFYPVRPGDCSWDLEDARHGDQPAAWRWLTLHLEKAHVNMRWLALTRPVGGEPEG